jgi:hypothetical protein
VSQLGAIAAQIEFIGLVIKQLARQSMKDIASTGPGAGSRRAPDPPAAFSRIEELNESTVAVSHNSGAPETLRTRDQSKIPHCPRSTV